jgi:dTDP-4-dehydrorhamnose 3,5-epimerase-like enzyme
MAQPTLVTVDDVKIIDRKGPWNTKSGGELNVLFGIDYTEIQTNFFSYGKDELAAIPKDVRGLRSYIVNGLPKGSIGANEWHKLRQELVFAISGSVSWTCEDAYGRKKVVTLDDKHGIWVPPHILHTYEALATNASLLVVANTLFFPEDPSTHDSYNANDFRELQASLQES